MSTAIASRAMNNTNQVTPWGNLSYNQTGTQTITLPDGTTRDVPTYTSTTSLTPTGQKTVDQQQQAQYGLAQLANAQTGRVSDTLGTKLDFNGQPSMVTGLDTSKITQLPTGVDNSHMAALPTGVDMSQINALPGIDPSQLIQGPTGINTGFAQYGVPKGINTSALSLLPTGVDTSGLPSQISGLNTGSLSAMPSDPTQMSSSVSQAMFANAKANLDPQWNQQEKDLRDQLTRQGIPEGSEAYTTALNNFQQQKTSAYNQANNSATVAGAQQGATDYGLALQGRQQGVTEQTTNAGLAAQAAQMGLTEQQLNDAIASGTVGQILSAQTANAGVANQAAQTGISAQTANAGVSNQAAQTQLAQLMAAVQAAQGKAGLNLQGQQLSGNQALSANQFQLQDQGQSAAMAGAAAQQQTQQQTLSAQLAQAARQQGISEQQYLYNLPLNQTSALLSGSQVQGPQFVNGPQTNMTGPNVLGAYALQNQAQQATYQQQMQNYSSGLGGMFGLAGAGLSAGLNGGEGGSSASLIGSMFSSRDFKEDNIPLNRLDVLLGVNRLPVERWRYKAGVADSSEHIGTYAEDFAREFGGDGRTIDVISMLGVLMISVQALTDKIGEMNDRIKTLEAA